VLTPVLMPVLPVLAGMPTQPARSGLVINNTGKPVSLARLGGKSAAMLHVFAASPYATQHSMQQQLCPSTTHGYQGRLQIIECHWHPLDFCCNQ